MHLGILPLILSLVIPAMSTALVAAETELVTPPLVPETGSIPLPGESTGEIQEQQHQYRHRPTIYFIRHGEKPKKGKGLSAEGIQRAQCLRNVFGKKSEYDVGYIMAQRPRRNGRQKRPFDTVRPVARDLGLAVDVGCRRDDAKCVVKRIERYQGKGNILICWEHARIRHIVRALGAKGKIPRYPENRFDLIWTYPLGYLGVTDVRSEMCPGLDRSNWEDYDEGEDDDTEEGEYESGYELEERDSELNLDLGLEL